MTKKFCTDEEFVTLCNTHGATGASKLLGCTERAVHKRKKNLSRYYQFDSPTSSDDALKKLYDHRSEISIKNGFVIVGSDFHIWPNSKSPALRAFKKLCKDLKPAAVILNGDVLDFPKIGKHAQIGWKEIPPLSAELEAAQDHLNDISIACGKAKKLWNVGNHDIRFNTFLNSNAPEFKGVKGTSLEDHFGLWKMTWSTWINDAIVVKHRWKSGIHATHNNTVNAGKTFITGHLHSQKITPFTDYNGTRYGVDTGCVAAPDHEAFTDYTEDNPKNWISGFVVLKFIDGRLLYPEIVCHWDDNHVQFRGEILRV